MIYENWQFVIRNSILGVMLIQARKNSRGSWITDPSKLPPYVQQFFILKDKIVDGFKSVDEAVISENGIHWQRTQSPGYEAKGIATIDATAKLMEREEKRRVKKVLRSIWAIKNLRDLADYLGVYGEGLWEKIAKRLFKDTECGISFSNHGDYVTVSGYCEGTDAECPVRELRFPFLPKDWETAVQAADDDGVKLWNEVHGE